jgi:hypothetical protein
MLGFASFYCFKFTAHSLLFAAIDAKKKKETRKYDATNWKNIVIKSIKANTAQESQGQDRQSHDR